LAVEAALQRPRRGVAEVAGRRGQVEGTHAVPLCSSATPITETA
jgi:hypothetical protein